MEILPEQFPIEYEMGVPKDAVEELKAKLNQLVRYLKEREDPTTNTPI